MTKQKISTTISCLATIGMFALIQTSTPATAEGYGEFEAYFVGLKENELVSVRKAPKKGQNKIGVIFGNAENIYVHWCDRFEKLLWCDVTHKKLRGWILGQNLQNVEGGG